ncbi:winged helix-turn-helix domain-containing protein [Sulfitobacter sp. S190]|uniref:winged helix-turn-helix domain-containing protein n=1 Tax=Sulfitobacter sp. S190 TaxID=2867022 RepID=UPI0021A7029E|nr:winged helix-turn-helix domain-containing protein [Sulfitobacter sp. S190]UWR21116.1 winged helix-turn-helix domain-containing protein [Sulfitobacter sp. S190]
MAVAPAIAHETRANTPEKSHADGCLDILGIIAPASPRRALDARWPGNIFALTENVTLLQGNRHNPEIAMMPVIRISDATFARLQTHARPLEDTAEDVVRLALDALDKSKGVKPAAPKPKKTRRRGNKTPQRDFRLPLMKVLLELGGSAEVKDIRDKMLPAMKARLTEDDFEAVSTGEERWWNATCWERSDLVKEGLFRDDSPRGVWELSDAGRAFVVQQVNK